MIPSTSLRNTDEVPEVVKKNRIMKEPADSFFYDKSILITGGTGSFGREFTKILLKTHRPRKLVVFSRDELKQLEMRTHGFDQECMRYFIGDVRDKDRLRRAMHGIDIVVHAAALKQVPACEYNPIEAVMTNVMGARNVIEAALDTGVKKVLALSTDKAVNPVNLYGATKLVAEKLIVHGNVYAGGSAPSFSCVRYGNVVGSRGSVVPLFLEQRRNGYVTVTDQRMTRFWITLEHGVRFVMRCLQLMRGGEVFIPKIPSMRVTDLAAALAPDCEIRFIGIRPGEKLHEVLVAEDEARQGIEVKDMFVLQAWANSDITHLEWHSALPLPEGFRYTSDANGQWLSVEELRNLVEGQSVKEKDVTGSPLS